MCDGDIDPEWIESLNSVLDDNRLLTMPSGERIQFGPNVNFLFETHDLSCASPATISRMGMIFLRQIYNYHLLFPTGILLFNMFQCFILDIFGFSDEDTDIKALVGSWLKRHQDERMRDVLSGWIDDHFYNALQIVLRSPDFIVDTTLVGVVMNGLSHFHKVYNKDHFALALVRGLGGNLSDAARTKFAKEVRFRHRFTAQA